MRSIAFCIKQLYGKHEWKMQISLHLDALFLDDKKEKSTALQKQRLYIKMKLMVAAKRIQQFIEQILMTMPRLFFGCGDCSRLLEAQSALLLLLLLQQSDVNAVRNDPLTLLIASFMWYHTPRREQTCLKRSSRQGLSNQSRWSPQRVTGWTGCEPRRTNVLVLQLSVIFRSETSQVGLCCGGKWIYWD